MMSNYPAGVSDNHPYFNPQEGSVHVTCGNDEAKVVPAFLMKTALEEIRVLAGGDYKGDGGLHRPASMGTVLRRIEQLIDSIPLVEQDSDYECPFADEMDVAISEEAEWTCPNCGATRTSDTTPDEPDPDRGWDDRD